MKPLSRILVAEDDKVLNHLIQKTLTKEGFLTEGVLSGKDTIARINGSGDTMLLLDYELSDMTGRQVIDSLSKKKCSVPFVVITGHGNENVAVEMMKLGAMDYVIKGPDFLNNMSYIIKRVDKELVYKHQLAKAEEALLLEKKRLETAVEEWKTTFDAISNFVSLHDTDLRFIKVNKALADFAGVEPKELIGKRCYESIFNLDRPCPGCNYQGMVKSGNTVTREIYDSARSMYLMVTISPIFDENRKLKGSVHYMRDISERKHSEEVLFRSEERYRRITGAITDYIYTVRLEWGSPVETTHSETCLVVTGYTSHEFAEDPYLWIKMVVEEDHDIVRGQAESILSGRFPQPIEHRIIRKDGSIRWVENTVVPYHDTNGNLLSYDGTVRDITERKQAEKKLKEREEQLRLTIEGSNTGMWNWDIINENMSISDKYAELLGYEPSEKDQLDLKTIISMTHPDDYPLMMEKVYDHFEQKTDSYSFESRMKTRQGTWKWFLDRGRITKRKDNGFPLRMMGTLSDITELKQAERFIIDLLESIGEGFVVVDRKFRILLANKAFCKHVNKTSREVTGRHCYKVTHQMDVPCHEENEECPVNETFKTGKPHIAYHTHYDLEANPVYIKIKSYPIKDVSGEIISVIENIVDITEEKRLESQLRHAQKMETVGQLAGGVAHDFNNILSAITNYGHILKMKIKNKEQRHTVEQILATAGRAANLTSDLLSFSRRKEMDLIPVSLNEIIEKSINLLSRLTGETIRLRKKLSKKELTITADSGQIEQVLMNLVTNARDAMPEGGTLTIETGKTVIDNKYIKLNGFGIPGTYAFIHISDTGTGMNEKVQSQIFEPFFTTKKVGKGTGLGLSTAYGIIKQHNGYINVNSSPGKGTSFKLYLPLTEAKAKKMRPPVYVNTTGGNETLLFAEDDKEVRQSTEKVLEEFGYKVIEAVDGEDAIEKYRLNKDRIQLLLLDVLMPRKNGKEVYDEIRKENPGIRALFMSGYTASIIHSKGHLEKGLNFISKPVTPVDISKKIREVLDK